MTISFHSSYALPEGMTSESVVRGLVELCRPCSETVVKYFVNLQAFKPLYGDDQERTQIIYDLLYEDIKDMPEVAVIVALDDLRNHDSKWFPIGEVVPAVSEYRDMIYDVLDWFKGDKNVS